MSWLSSQMWSLQAPLVPLGELTRLAIENAMPIVIAAVALAVLVLWRGLARARRRIRILAGELARTQMQVLGIERLQFEADAKASRDEVRLAQLERAQRRATAGFGKPDHALAMAMVRGGAGDRALVDCGLSHAESHLMRALNSRSSADRRETDPCVILSGHED